MIDKKCDAAIEFMATTPREYHYVGFVPKAEFYCCKKQGHRGPHHAYGSISEGSISTEYSVDWGNPTSCVQTQH